jgi:hypothetical protein
MTVGDDQVPVKAQNVVLAEYRDGRLGLVATTRDPSLLWVSVWHASQDKPVGEVGLGVAWEPARGDLARHRPDSHYRRQRRREA